MAATAVMVVVMVPVVVMADNDLNVFLMLLSSDRRAKVGGRGAQRRNSRPAEGG